MSIHFAAARGPAASPVARVLTCRPLTLAANDNPSAGTTPIPSEKLLRAALLHFGEHGLGAARAARGKAEQAFFAGDRQGYDWWLGITRTLDRRLAQEAERGMPHAQINPEKAG
ncbi:MAG: hypothetical protein AAF941_00910 [Pseudomonadota bacterium]